MASFLSWNCRGFRNKLVDIKSLISDDQPACFAFQETFLKPDITAKIRRYTCNRKDFTTSDRVTGGVAILTSHKFPSASLSLHTSLQAIAVQIQTHSYITFCTLNLPPSETIDQKELNTLIEQLPAPFVLVGDFNAHSTLCGSVHTNSRGKQIEKLLSDYCLCLLNSGEETYFYEPTRTFHSIDLAIVSSSFFPYCTFTVKKYLYNSDHFRIIITYHMKSTNLTKGHQRYIYEKANWDLFSTLSDITKIIMVGDIDSVVKGLGY